MELAQAQEIIRRLDRPVPTNAWDTEVILAVQCCLGALHLLNPFDDVDGVFGPRTREAWRYFVDPMGVAAHDTIDADTSMRLAEAVSDPGALIGHRKVELSPEFPFRRGRRQANRKPSAEAIILAAREQQLETAQIAYVLATAEHESDSFDTLEEYDDGLRYEGRANLGNDQPGDGRRYKGRGYVQLTGRRNYARYSEITGLDLIRLPTLLMNWPALSVFVIVDGMMRGVYTGRRLGQFVSDDKCDFVNARQVVNDHDRAEKIAHQAEGWLADLA